MITLLADPRRLASAEISVEGDSYRHLFRARRMRVGERLRVVDGAGHARWGTVVTVAASSARVELAEQAPGHEAARDLDLLVATPRPERASWLVEKATELGVRAVRFLHTERAPRALTAAATTRLRRVAAAALEQCHGSRLPELSGPHGLSELAEATAGMATRWLFDTAAPAAGWGDCGGASGALLIGPEGGWSDGERRTLAAGGWRAVGLGPRVLRIETAALAGAALLLLPAPPGGTAVVGGRERPRAAGC